MWEFLDHLRSKPLAVRQRIAVVVAGALSVLVFMGWWGGLTANDHVDPLVEAGQKSPVAVVGETLKSLTNRSRTLWRDSMTQIKYDAQSELAGTAAAGGEINLMDSGAVPLTPSATETDTAPTKPETNDQSAVKPDGVFPEGTDSSYEATTQTNTTTN